jgi:exodeoxyribonuclease VII large subunit
MGRKTTTQWDFGELFPAEPARHVYTVGELTGAVKRLLERELGSVWVSGEMSNYRMQSSGHAYFTLKDAAAQLSCVLFRGTSTPYRELFKDGCHLVLQGELTVYGPRGQYQLVARQVEIQGVGALQVAFEKLKRKLDAEGLFAPDRKRPIPVIIERLGLVTSPTGAALRDVLHVASRRHPGLQVVLAPCRVQGEGAAAEIASAIEQLNRWAARRAQRPYLDAILVTRGGGSLEDLWAYNEEVMAKAIAASTVPVISAVGHEIDFTISDFTADLRAATPSAAAELLTEGVHASRLWVEEAPSRMSRVLWDRFASEREALEEIQTRIVRAHPRRQIESLAQRVDDLQTALVRSARAAWRIRAAEWEAFRRRWQSLSPVQRLQLEREQSRSLLRRLRGGGILGVERKQKALAQASTRLRLLSPQNVLDRGFSITWEAENGAVVRDPEHLQSGQRLRTRVQHGEVHSLVVRREEQE